MVSGAGGKARGPGWRSLQALAWLARVEVAGIEPLGLAMGFGHRSTYSHVARLRRAGLLERAFDADGSVVAITAAGRRTIGADRGDVRAGATHGSGLRHARAVSWVAALLELRGREWVSERELRGHADWEIPVVWAASRGRHRPDLGVVMAGGARVAVEVELSRKSPRRLRAIFAGHEQAISSGQIAGGLIYVSDRPDVLAAVRDAADRAGLPEARFRTRALADVQGEVRRLTAELMAGRPVPPAREPGGRGERAAVGTARVQAGVDERGGVR